jgi:hypothetical protein
LKEKFLTVNPSPKP